MVQIIIIIIFINFMKNQLKKYIMASCVVCYLPENMIINVIFYIKLYFYLILLWESNWQNTLRQTTLRSKQYYNNHYDKLQINNHQGNNNLFLNILF